MSFWRKVKTCRKCGDILPMWFTREDVCPKCGAYPLFCDIKRAKPKLFHGWIIKNLED